MRYLLDTNIISELIKSEPNESVLNSVELHRRESVTGAPVWHELRFGCLRLSESRKRKMIELFLSDVIEKYMSILPYDEQAAR